MQIQRLGRQIAVRFGHGLQRGRPLGGILNVQRAHELGGGFAIARLPHQIVEARDRQNHDHENDAGRVRERVVAHVLD